MNLYISKIEEYLNCERVEINVAQTWQEIQPNGVTASIFDFLSTVQSWSPHYLLSLTFVIDISNDDASGIL